MDFIDSLMQFRFANKMSINSGGNVISYSELIDNVLRFASYLSEKEIKSVIIKTARSANAVTAALGVMFSGGVYAFLADVTPVEYIDSAVTDLQASLIVDDNIDFDDYSPVAKNFTPKKRLDDDIVCAVFSSGSTGKPKGALLTYRALNETISWQTDYMNLPENSHTCSYAQFSFIAAFWELWYPLANGFTLYIPDKKTCLDTRIFCDFINKHDIAYAFLPPAVAEIFTEVYTGGSLKFLRVAGGSLASCAQPHGYEILYSLGMSENAGSVTFLPIKNAMTGDIPIGKPFNYTEIYLIDGEMAVSGPSLFAGYANRPELSKSALVPNPYANKRELYEKMYMSGDLAELDSDGNLVYIGRRDWIVKINNVKTNPLEIERIILENEDVNEVAVLPFYREDKSVYLVCFYTGNSEEKSLKNYAKERLLPTFVPSIFVKQNDMPKNSNGKIDRKKLVLPTQSDKLICTVSMTESEKNIASAFEKILSLQSGFVGPDDSFIQLGGNSLNMMRLQAELYKNASLDLRYSDILTAETPREIAKLSPNLTSIIKTKPLLNKPYPLTAPERQMWLLWRTGQDNGRYTVRIQCDFDGDINREKALIVLKKLSEMHPVLRSYYTEADHEISRYFSDEKITFSTAEHSKFDLCKPPLFSAVLLKNSLIFIAHHIIADAAAMRVLMEDFWTLYYDKTPETALPFHDLEILESVASYETDESFWEKALQRFSYIPMPIEITPDVTKEFVLNFTEDETSKLKTFAAKMGVTLFNIFTAAAATLISVILKNKCVCIGVPASGRDLPETIRTVGMLVRTLPIMIEVSDFFDETIKTTVESLKNAFSHQNYPFETMNERFGARYDVMVNFIPLPKELETPATLAPRIKRSSYPAPAVKLVIDLREEENGISAVFTYDEYSDETIKNWAKNFHSIIFSKSAKDVIIPAQNPTNDSNSYSLDLAEVWKSILQNKEIIPSDNFFELGGTSLKAIQIEEAMLCRGLYISAADILRLQSFSKISELVITADEIDWEEE